MVKIVGTALKGQRDCHLENSNILRSQLLEEQRRTEDLMNGTVDDFDPLLSLNLPNQFWFTRRSLGSVGRQINHRGHRKPDISFAKQWSN